MDFNITTQMLSMIISRASFDLQGPGLKVKVTIAGFRENLVIALVPTFIDGF